MTETLPMSRTLAKSEHEYHLEVLDHGYVELVGTTFDFADAAGFDPDTWVLSKHDFDLDAAVVRAARVSYQRGTTKLRDDAQLIDYLMRKRHTSPFEQVELKFVIRAPLFVVQQLLRHRTANINQESARYSVLEDEVYYPEEYRSQSSTNRQSSDVVLSPANHELADRAYTMGIESAMAGYRRQIEIGVAREQARGVLPHATYTSLVMKFDLHNLLHFLKLRLDEHAQQETRQYATAMYHLAYRLAPLTFSAWERHVMDAVTFSADELHVVSQIMRHGLSAHPANMRETIKTILDESGLRKTRRDEVRDKLAYVLMEDLSDA